MQIIKKLKAWKVNTLTKENIKKTATYPTLHDIISSKVTG